MLPRGLLKEHAQFFSLLLRVMDVAAILMAGSVVAWIRMGGSAFSGHNLAALLLAACMTAPVFSFFQLYESTRVLAVGQYLGRLLQAWISLLILLAGLAFLTKTGESFSRAWFLLSGGLFIALLMVMRGGLLLFLRLMRRHGWNERQVIIVGAGPTGRRLADILQQKLWTGFRVSQLFDDEPGATVFEGMAVTKTPDNLDRWLTAHKGSVDEVWIALPLEQKCRIQTLLHQLRHHTAVVRLALDIFPVLGISAHSIADMGGLPMVSLNAAPLTPINRIQKAIEDRLIAGVLLVLLLPLMLLIAVGVRLSSPGPIFFRQRRLGWDGEVIKIYKFRTMVCHEEPNGGVTQARRSDPRVTAFGRWLRRTSLDELPQFINVLQGRMSIVGPRPHALAHNDYYRDMITDYMQRHKVKPGITGWAQVNGWRGETDTLDKMQKRVEYDLYYIENWSLFFDFKIIFLTLIHGLSDKNAF